MWPRLQPYVKHATLAHLGAIVDEAARRRGLITLEVGKPLVLLALVLALGLGCVGDEEVRSCCGSAAPSRSPSQSYAASRRAGIYLPLRCPPAAGRNRVRRLTRHACGGHRVVLERASLARPHPTSQGGGGCGRSRRGRTASPLTSPLTSPLPSPLACPLVAPGLRAGAWRARRCLAQAAQAAERLRRWSHREHQVLRAALLR
jgi:hypothetical protein